MCSSARFGTGTSDPATRTRTFADVRRALLLDASPTGWPEVVCSVPAYGEACDLMHDPARDAERLDVFSAFDEVARLTSLGDLPRTVMTGAHRDPTGLAPDEVERLDTTWAAVQERWAGLSSSPRIVTVEWTGHHIEVDQPARVVDEVQALLSTGRPES